MVSQLTREYSQIHEQNATQVFYTSPWIPPEWIKTHGLKPRGVWFTKDPWLNSLPLASGVCAFAEAMVRFAEAQADSAVIFTSTCDQQRRGFDALTAADRSRAFLFNIPVVWQTPAASQAYRCEVERLGRFLQDLGGHVPSLKRLGKEMTRYGQDRARLLDVAQSYSSRQFAESIARFHWDGSLQLPSPSASALMNGVPLAIVGGPLSAAHWDLLDAIETMGGHVVLNATETGERTLLPAFASDHSADDPFNVLVRGYFENIVDVFQRPNTRLYSWLKKHMTARNIRGIILWHFTGCDLWRAEAQTLRETFGLPVLLLEADEKQFCSPRDVGRIEAFVEMLK